MHVKRPSNACKETYQCMIRGLLMRAHLPSAHATCARQVLQAPMCGCEFVAAASLHTSAYVSIRQHTSAYDVWVRVRGGRLAAYVSIREHT